MGRKTVVILIDDIDGGDAVRTAMFSLHGTDYEIDLNSSNLDALVSALDPFVKNARTVGRLRTSTNGGKGTAASGRNLAEVRVWARDNGFTVSDRGRVSAEIMTAYEQRA